MIVGRTTLDGSYPRRKRLDGSYPGRRIADGSCPDRRTLDGPCPREDCTTAVNFDDPSRLSFGCERYRFRGTPVPSAWKVLASEALVMTDKLRALKRAIS